MKKILTMSLLTFMLTFTSTAVYANVTAPISNIGIAPFWTYLEQLKNNLDISSSGKATIDTRITTDRSITKVSISSTLQQKKNGSWVDVKTWSTTRDSSSAILDGSYYVMKGYDYRLVSTYKAYINNTLKESEEMISYDEYY